MGVKKSLPSDEILIASAKAYRDIKHIRTENIMLYDRIIRKKLSELAFSHMPKRSVRQKEIEGGWPLKTLEAEIGKYEYLCDLREYSPNAYAAIIRKKLTHLTSKLKRGQRIRTEEDIRKEASLCGSRKEFKNRFPGSYEASLRRGKAFHEKICSKMKRPKSQESLAEIELLAWVKIERPDAHKTRIYYVNEKGNRTYYEYDIFIPELNIAIEYQGLYWHNNKMTKNDPDRVFKKAELAKNHGIRLIVIFEDDWEKNSFMIKEKLRRTFEKRDVDGILNCLTLLKRDQKALNQSYFFESSNAWQDHSLYEEAGLEFVKDVPPKTYFINNKKRITNNDTGKDLPTIRDMGGKIWKAVL